MIKLLLGASGSGKTYRICEMIRRDAECGIQSVLIVPEQETVSAERRMTDLLPPSAQLTFEVTNFTRLANRVFRVYGGLTYEYISQGAKSLAMWNTLRALSPLLSFYGTQVSDPAFSSLMLSASEEMKAYRITPAMLERASDAADDGSRTKKKLFDLALIYASYQNSISGYGDGSDDIGKLASVLDQHEFFTGFHVYIDSFTSFTSAELAVISRIASQAETLTVSLCLADHAGLQFDAIEKSVRKIEHIAEKNGVCLEKEMLSGNKRTADPELCRVERDIWSFDGTTDGTTDGSEPPNGSVELIKCTNVYEEAEAAAVKVGELIRSGMRYRDIVILARDITSYEGIIDDALEKADIPFFMSRSRDVTSMPLSKLLLCALHIIGNSWRGEDVITYMKTGLCSLSDYESDMLEEYIWRWSINGDAFFGDDWTMNPYSYAGETDDKSKEILDAVNGARRKIVSSLTALSRALDNAENNAGMCRAVFEYMESLSVADIMRKRAEKAAEAGEVENASEMLQLYNTVLESLSIIAEFDTDDGKFEVREFEEALKIVLSGATIGSIPTSCDEVTVGSASLLRANEPRAVIVIGMNEGVFPRSVSENGIFSDEERRFLNECGVETSADTVEKSSEELFYVYRAVSAPSEKLILMYPASELRGGKEILPSVAFTRVSYITGENVTDYASLPFDKKLPCEKSAFEYAFALGDTSEGKALRRYFREKEEYKSALGRLTLPLFDRECFVPTDKADLAFGTHMSFSPSAIEKYVKCHFEYYCENILKLRPSEKNIMKLSDTGTLIHELLEKFIRRVTGENGFDATLADEEIEELLSEIERLYIEENFPEKDRGKAKTEYLMGKLHGLSVLIVKNITNELKNGKFVPAFFELKINEHGGEGCATGPSFVIDGDKEASLHGFIDRVDLMRDGDDVYVKVIDYKTGSKKFSLDNIKDGLDTQMLLYLFALCDNEENRALLGCAENGKVIPAGAVYLLSRVEKTKGYNSATDKDELMADADKKLTREGILLADERITGEMKARKGVKLQFKTDAEFDGIRDELKTAITGILTDIRHGDARIYPRKTGDKYPCEYCGMRAVCRSVHVQKDGGEEDS